MDGYKKPTKFQSDYYLKEEYEIAKIKYKYNIAKCFYHIISFLCSFTDNNSPYWYISKIIQKTLMQVFALAQNNNIDLMEYIKLKCSITNHVRIFTDANIRRIKLCLE